MSEDLLVQYLKECLLKGKQTPTHVNVSLKKLTIKGKTKPLSFQKVGHENGHLKVTWFGHFVMPSRMGKCQFQHVPLH